MSHYLFTFVFNYVLGSECCHRDFSCRWLFHSSCSVIHYFYFNWFDKTNKFHHQWNISCYTNLYFCHKFVKLFTLKPHSCKFVCNFSINESCAHYQSFYFYFYRFRHDLEDVARQIDINNSARDMHHQYRALDPSLMPNYPGI